MSFLYELQQQKKARIINDGKTVQLVLSTGQLIDLPFGESPFAASQVLGMSLNKVYKLLRSGQLRAVKRSNMWTISLDNLLKYCVGIGAIR